MKSSSRRWQPSPLLRGSAVLHGAAALLLAARPQAWAWALGAIAANHAQLTALGLWPRSRALGANWTRLPAAAAARRQIAITIDDGPDPEVTPRVLSILRAHRARATFFCIGERVERHPDCARACLAEGHALENHSYSHPHHFAWLGPGGLRREIELAGAAIERLGAVSPRFFRAPAGLRSPLLDPVLQPLGLRLATWTRRGFDTVRRDPGTVLARLTHDLAAGDILLLHDGHAARTARGVPVILEVLPPLLAAAASRGLTPVTLAETLA